jgi:hypothetical protein
LKSTLKKFVQVAVIIGCWCAAVFATDLQQTDPMPADMLSMSAVQPTSTASISEQTHVQQLKLVVNTMTPTATDFRSVNLTSEETDEEDVEMELDDKQEKDVSDENEDGFIYIPDIELSEELQQYTYTLCQEKGLRYTMVLALMYRESRFQADAIGYNTNGTTDSGLMQLNDIARPFLKENFGITNLMDPYSNIDAGTSLLDYYQEKYESESCMLMAYQYGEGGMLSKQERGIYTSTATDKLYQFEAEFKNKIIQASTNTSLDDV